MFKDPFLVKVEFAEADAVLQEIQLAIAFGLTPLIVELNSVNVVSLIDGSVSSRKGIGWLISEIKGLMIIRASIMVKHAPTSCNVVAHHLAKLAFSFPKGYIWIEDCPAEIASLF